MRRPVVVKFGGSLLASPERPGLLRAAAAAGAIVVPGGGRHADAVRAAQARDGFSDLRAHRLAILAMDETARALHAAEPSLALAATLDELSAATAAGIGAIWLPSPLALEADVPASWDVTSDSLALWLAAGLGAARLVLLKAAAVPAGSTADTWCEAGLVDAFFPKLAEEFAGEIDCLGCASGPALAAALAAPMQAAA